MTAAPLHLSVILCTYNPRADLIARALRALGAQTLARRRWELIVVDNNSTPALDADRLERLAARPIRLLREPRQGLVFARACGIAAARASEIVFVDDDNELASDYLDAALRVFHAEPDLGCFGGVCEGALERGVGRLKRAYLPHLGVREVGDAPLTGSGAAWGLHEPIGAGLCVRANVAEAYRTFVETDAGASGLGRQGAALLSGEDSLFSRIADVLGYAVGYRPQLFLRHHITARRLTYRYLARLLEGHGVSQVALRRLGGETISPPPRGSIWRNFGHRWRTEGLASALGHIFWDRGFARAAAQTAQTPPQALSPERLGRRAA
ncbi:MAG: glycosyltransferase [Maricaulaceae bacterium]